MSRESIIYITLYFLNLLIYLVGIYRLKQIYEKKTFIQGRVVDFQQVEDQKDNDKYKIVIFDKRKNKFHNLIFRKKDEIKIHIGDYVVGNLYELYTIIGMNGEVI